MSLICPMRPIFYRNQQGMIGLLIVTVVMSIGSALAFASVFMALNHAKGAKNIAHSYESIYASEAGIEDAQYRVIKNKQYPASYTLSVGGSTVDVSISGSDTKTITADSEAKNIFRNTRTVLALNPVIPEFHYGVQVGEGGVAMGQNSQIQGVGGVAGNFYSNGQVVGDNGATITGDVTVATGISLAEEFTVCNADQVVGQTDPQIDFTQSFLASDSKPLAKVGLYLKKVGSPGDRTIYVANDAAGVPATTALASATLNESLVTTSYSWIEIAFPSPAALIAGNTYWIILDAGKNATKYWVWCKDLGAGYANGQIKYSKDWNSQPWTGVSGDLTFKTYLGTGASSINDVIVYGTVRANSITNSKICGDAYYQATTTIDASSKSFLNSPTNPTCNGNPLTPGTGFPNQPDPAVSNMPISQGEIDTWKTEATNGGTISGNCGDDNQSGGSDPLCTIPNNGNLFLGPKKITGNLTLTKKQTLTITGTLYVEGNVDFDSASGSTVKCDASFSANSCLIVAGGWVYVKNNAVFQGSGVSGSYILLLTTLAGCNGGVQQPQCTDHNGAIDVLNNATGAIFYTAHSLAHLHNGVNISEITAYKLEIGNNAIVTYEQGLVNAQFSSGPGGSWEVESWKEVE